MDDQEGINLVTSNVNLLPIHVRKGRFSESDDDDSRWWFSSFTIVTCPTRTSDWRRIWRSCSLSDFSDLLLLPLQRQSDRVLGGSGDGPNAIHDDKKMKSKWLSSRPSPPSSSNWIHLCKMEIKTYSSPSLILGGRIFDQSVSQQNDRVSLLWRLMDFDLESLGRSFPIGSVVLKALTQVSQNNK